MNQPPAGDPLLGRVLADRYQILQAIGEGGMGVVYRAVQVATGFPVAVKVLAAHLTSDPAWIARFKTEAEAISKLTSPNTVKLVDYGLASDGTLFIAMEFLAGEPLRSLLDRVRTLPPARALWIIMQCCSSLGEAHAIGIVHRDVKPDNIFVEPTPQGDFVKVLDFSVAKDYGSASAQQTRAGLVLGTPEYMSPEQGRGQPQDARTDLYGLGVLLFEMLMGQVPFTAHAPMEVLAAHVTKPPPPLNGVPDLVARIVLRALEKDPARRFQSAQEMVAECQNALMALAPPMQAVPSSALGPQEQTFSGPLAGNAAPGDYTAGPRRRPSGESALLFWGAWIGAALVAGLLAYVLVVHLG